VNLAAGLKERKIEQAFSFQIAQDVAPENEDFLLLINDK
jgi:hypothetical protein